MSVSHANALGTDGSLRRAAAYVRMSTEHQKYSIENQMQVIADYAKARGIEIVRTYADVGRSGLSLQGRDGLRQLMADVWGGRSDFVLILVYDVSRWGRFRDIDESAHYEFLCRKAGASIEYCAEGFDNDGSIVATLIKGVRRVMAHEYSRELSAKTFAGHSRSAHKGYSQGGTAGFGLRRILIDRAGHQKTILEYGERKALQSDRVVLAPGPLEEVQAVREIFRLYVEDRLSHRRIARIFNLNGIRSERGNSWTQSNVILILRSERYVGHLVYNRTSVKMQSKRAFNPRSQWIRSEAVIKPIVEREMFDAAQRRLNQGWEVSDNDLLNHLTAVWCVAGWLSCKNLMAIETTPVVNTYRERFGSVDEAFRLVGHRRTHRYRYTCVGSRLRQLERDLVCRLTSTALPWADKIRYDPDGQIFSVSGRTTVAMAVLPHSSKGNCRPGWWLYFDHYPKGDLLLIVRLNEANNGMLDCHLLPYPKRTGPTFRFTSAFMSSSAHRLGSIDDFFKVFNVVANTMEDDL